MAEHSAAPGRNRRSQGQGQGQGQAGGRTPGQGLAQDAQKRGKDEEGPGRPAKRARNGEKEERDAQRSARNGERGPGEAAFRQNDNPGSTAKTVKAVGLRSSETDARKERGSQLSGERGASTNRGVVEESQKRSTEERSESQGGVRASQRAAERAAERSEGRKTGDPLRDPPGKSDVGRKQEGSQTVVPGVRDVSSPPGFQDSRVFQLSTPLQRHRESSTPQKSSPLADAIKQKVQLWQSAKAGATSAGGVRVDHEVSGSAGVVNLGHGESDRREGFNTSHGRHVHTRREGAIHTDQRGGLNTNRERGPVTDAQAVRRPSPSDGNSRDRPKLSAGRGRGGQSARLPSPLVSNPRDRQKLSVGRGRGGRAPPDAGGNQSNVPTSHAQLAQRLAEIKERFSATPSPKPAAAAGHRGSFERPLSAEAPRDPVKDFVAEIKERVSSPVEKVTSKFQKGNPDFKASEGVPANERLARIKERLSITPPPPERSPSRGPQPQTPAANSRLAQIKERLSFPAAKIKPPESPPPPPLAPILIAPQPSGFPASQKPHSKTAPTPVPRKTVEAPVSHRKATGAAGAVSGASGVNLGSEPGVSRGTAPAGSGAGAGQPGGVNEHQAEKSLKDRQVWKVPEKLQKLLDQGRALFIAKCMHRMGCALCDKTYI